MKKILLATTLALAIISCKKEGDSSSNASTSGENNYESPANLGKDGKDASYAFGVSLGQAAEGYNKNPQLKDSLNAADVKRGIEDYFDDAGKLDSYAYGINAGKQIAGALDNDILKGKLDKDIIITAMMDVLNKKDLKISKDSVRGVMDSYYKGIQKAASETNAKEGIAYMNKVKKEDGVKTTESGLAYKVIEAGSGATPKEGDVVSVKYTGKLINGDVFDSTDKNNNGEAMDLPLRAGSLIQGWVEGMQLMPKGSKYQFYIPSELGYGERGSGKIQPGSTLIFDIELVDIKEGKTPGQQPGVKINPKK